MKTSPARRFPLLLTVAVIAIGAAVAITHAQSDDPFGGGEAADDPFSGEAAEGADPFGPARAVEKHEDGHGDHARSTVTLEQPVIWANRRGAPTQRIEALLDKPLKDSGLEFIDTPLEQVIEFLRSEYKIEIVLDNSALDDLGIGLDEPVSVNLRNIKLASALDLMLKQLELTKVIDHDLLLITTEEEAQTRLEVGIYPVGDLINAGESSASLVENLVAILARETWAINGGGEAEIRSHRPGLLVVSQTQAIHQELLNALNAIRQASQLPEAQVSPEAKAWNKLPEKQKSRSNRTSGGFGVGGGGGGGQFSIPE